MQFVLGKTTSDCFYYYWLYDHLHTYINRRYCLKLLLPKIIRLSNSLPSRRFVHWVNHLPNSWRSMLWWNYRQKLVYVIDVVENVMDCGVSQTYVNFFITIFHWNSVSEIVLSLTEWHYIDLTQTFYWFLQLSHTTEDTNFYIYTNPPGTQNSPGAWVTKKFPC